MDGIYVDAGSRRRAVTVTAVNDVLVHLRRCSVDREITEITDELGRPHQRPILPLSPTSSSSSVAATATAVAVATLIDNHVVPDARLSVTRFHVTIFSFSFNIAAKVSLLRPNATQKLWHSLSLAKMNNFSRQSKMND